MKLLFLFGGGKWSSEAQDLALSYTAKISRTESVEEKLVLSKWNVPKDIRDGESTAMLVTLKPTDFLIVFDERGKKMSSEQFSSLLGRGEQEGKRVVITVGGAYGMNDELRARAQHIVSFGDMIFPHDLARIMAMEQVYRGLAIRNGSPYHHAG